MTDRVALITGGAHGIGAATARRLAAAGDHVIVADIEVDAGRQLSDEIVAGGGLAEFIRLDVGDTQSWESARAQCEAGGRRVSVVVNNAYTIARGPAHEIDDVSWASQVNVILGGVHRSVRTFYDHLAPGGAIVNVASVHAISGWAGHPAYAAAKGGVLALTRQLAVEYGPGIRVNAVIPGTIETRAWDGLLDDKTRAGLNADIVAGRLGTADEVASAIVFLASDDASYITGTSVLVDGGLTIRS